MDENNEKIAKEAGFDLIVEGMITKAIMEDIVFMASKKQKLFADYVKLLD